MAFFWRNKALLAKLETTYGEDSGPTGALNAILASNVTLRPMEGQQVTRENDRGFLGARPSTWANLQISLEFDVEAAGSGTAGTPPAYAVLLEGCGFAETLLTGAATIQDSPPTPTSSPTGDFTYTKGDPYTGTVARTVTLTCTNAGGSGVATFDVAAPQVEGLAAYSQSAVLMTDAMPFALPGGATITPTVGTAFALGDAYTITLTPARADYAPISDSALFKGVTLYLNVDGTRHALLGARGTVALRYSTPGYPMWRFTFTGLFSDPITEALPTPTLSAFQKPKVISAENTPWFSLHGVDQLPLQELEISVGQQVEGRHLVNTRAVLISDRNATGRAVIEAQALATFNPFARAKAGTTGAFAIVHGTAAGEIVRVDAPQVELGAPDYDQSQGIVTWPLGLTFIPTDAGNDELVFSIR